MYFSTQLIHLLLQPRNKAMAGAARIFVILKLLCADHGTFQVTPELNEELLKRASKYEIDKHFSYLLRHGWMGKNSSGTYFLRGKRLQTIVANLTNCYFSTVKVSMEHVETRASWRSFCCGVSITSAVKAQKYADGNLNPGGEFAVFKQGKRVVKAATTSKHTSAEKLPNAFICGRLKCSKATASRILTNAHDSGYICRKHELNMLKKKIDLPKKSEKKRDSKGRLKVFTTKARTKNKTTFTWSEYMYVRCDILKKRGVVDANKLVYLNGHIFAQKENLVSANKIKFHHLITDKSYSFSV